MVNYIYLLFLLKIFHKIKLSPFKSILFLFFSLNSFIEIRQILRKRRKHFVPFSLNLNRRIFFSLKWLKLALKSDNRKIPLREKLVFEVLMMKGGEFGLHSHKDCSEITYVESGSMFERISNNDYKAGDTAIFLSSQEHEIIALENTFLIVTFLRD